MTQLQIADEKKSTFQVIFASMVVLSLTIAIFVGLNLITIKNCIILPRSPFDGESFMGAAIKVCAWDIFLVWLLTIPFSNTVTVIVSSAVFFFRGLVIGASCRVFFENSVTSAAVSVLISYLTITMLSLFYDAYLNGFGQRSALCRVLSCFVATGACGIIRVLPMLLL